MENKISKRSYWAIEKVQPNRKKDNFIAFVLPNRRVYIDSMSHHLSKCSKGGIRGITSIVRKHGLNQCHLQP